MSGKRGRGLVWIWLGAALVLIILLATAPVISVLLAAGIADVLGCGLNEGGSSACVFLGVDLGTTLSVMFVFGWLAMETLPLGALALAVWLVAALIVAVVQWRRRRRVA
jgi:hypothetical protein